MNGSTKKMSLLNFSEDKDIKNYLKLYVEKEQWNTGAALQYFTPFYPNYVLELDPELIVLNSFVDPKAEDGGYQANYWMGETVLYQHPQFIQRYVPIARSWRRVRHGGGFASIWLFKRRKQ